MPAFEEITTSNGEPAWVITHHSIDGREKTETSVSGATPDPESKDT
jgi:hypothetical protein